MAIDLRAEDLSTVQMLYLPHGILVLTILSLVAVHIARVVRHWRIKHDRGMRCMTLLG